MFDGTIRVFISYSHDSPEHVDAVATFAQRLREEGVDATIDQFVMSPPEGWPAWMHREIEEATFVIVVCTPGYFAKVNGQVEHNRGLGVKWEGAIITDALYGEGGRNVKFIPVVCAEADTTSVPYFLQGATRYNISDERSFLALYRHLTDQPRVTPKPLGVVRKLPSDQPSPSPAGTAPTIASVPNGEPVLLFSKTAGIFVVSAREIVVTDTVKFELVPDSEEVSAFLAELPKAGHSELAVAYGSQAALCRVNSVTSVRRGGVESVTLTVRAIESDYGTMMEMTTTGHSAESIAEKRARRILLNETLASRYASADNTANEMSNAMLEAMVRGLNVPLEIRESPIPFLYESLGANPTEFLRTARLVCVLYLRLSGTVERTTRLELSLNGQKLQVDFEGLRPKKYSNRDAHRIAFTGTLAL